MEGIPLALDAEKSPMLELLVIGNLECTWKRYKNFPIAGANASGVKKWPLPSVHSKYSNITAN